MSSAMHFRCSREQAISSTSCEGSKPYEVAWTIG